MLLIGAAAVVIMIVLALVFSMMSPTMRDAETLMRSATPFVTLLTVMPASIYTGAILGVRRLHDLNCTGRWMIAYYACYAACLGTSFAGIFMPAFNLVSLLLSGLSALALVALVVLPGTKDANRYGPVPPRF
jgi:uncharacterized membrane protein YhaH (DUF805 family)